MKKVFHAGSMRLSTEILNRISSGDTEVSSTGKPGMESI